MAPGSTASTIFVEPNEDTVYAWNWTVGASLIITIDDPATIGVMDYTGTMTAAAKDDWDHGLNLGGIFDINPGYVVTVSREGITKQHIVTHLTVTNIDIDADTVSGTAYPGSSIHVGTECDETGCANRNLIVDATGTWTVDFSTPVSDPSQGMGTIDLRPGSDSHVYEHDEDGDSMCTLLHVHTRSSRLRCPVRKTGYSDGTHCFFWTISLICQNLSTY